LLLDFLAATYATAADAAGWDRKALFHWCSWESASALAFSPNEGRRLMALRDEAGSLAIGPLSKDKPTLSEYSSNGPD
jgi:hypothetical protein